ALHWGHLLPCTELRLDRRGPLLRAPAIEPPEVSHVDASVATAACDDDGTRPDAFPVREIEAEPRLGPPDVIASKLRGLGWNRHLDAELLRLIVGARHEGQAADAGRKAEIVLDPPRCARLAAEGAAGEDQHREPLRRRIDGGGKPRRPRANDRDVVDLRGIEGSNEAEATRELHLARIAEELPAGAEDDRQVLAVEVKTFEQRLRVGVGVRVELVVRVSVPA